MSTYEISCNETNVDLSPFLTFNILTRKYAVVLQPDVSNRQKKPNPLISGMRSELYRECVYPMIIKRPKI
jgi:hypothetical protein